MCDTCPSEKPTRRSLIKWSAAAAAAAAAVPLAGTAQAAGLSIATGAKRGAAFYVAQAGDTLKTIAGRFLGNVDRWKELLAANPGLHGRDPRAGQKVTLPESPAGPNTRTFAPIPADSKPTPFGPEGYRLTRFGDRGYGVQVGPGQSAFVVTDTGVVVLDAPSSHAAVLPKVIASVTDKPVTHFVYSHSHSDHVGAANLFANAVLIGHADTASTLRAAKDPARPVPTVTFTDQHVLDVGGQRLVLSYPGPNHESGNIIIHAPQQRFAMMVDVAVPGWAPFRAFGSADSVPGVLRAHNELMKLDIEHFVGGHMHRYGGKQDIAVSREFVFDMWNETTKAIAATPIAPFFGQVEAGNTWAAVELWYDAIAVKAEDPIIRKWTGRLGAVDVWLRENLKTMAVSARVDQPKDLGV
ncbi:MBL fold metallo-hydrolase [Lentzea tibetensis]|uniref:MBL fold metallo-hydrolase n=1 Tax=Lentzea tibetensis TaxID=2591470 RepID=UPI001646ABBE|nr:MBL fold metallo-hydrolase [Lentzea tibetensis]